MAHALSSRMDGKTVLPETQIEGKLFRTLINNVLSYFRNMYCSWFLLFGQLMWLNFMVNFTQLRTLQNYFCDEQCCWEMKVFVSTNSHASQQNICGIMT